MHPPSSVTSVEATMLEALTCDPPDSIVEVTVWDLVVLNVLMNRFQKLSPERHLEGLRQMASQGWLKKWVEETDPGQLVQKIKAFRTARRLNKT